jgi:HEAT repeat protein
MTIALGRPCVGAILLFAAVSIAAAQPGTPVSSSHCQSQQPDDSIAQAIAQLKDPDQAVRYRAALALGRVKDARAADPLIAALHDPGDDVRDEAAKSLGDLGDERAIEPLITLLADKSEKLWIRESVCESLGNLRAVVAIDPLIRMLGNRDFGIQNHASEALVKIGEPAVEPLIAALSNANPQVRRRAVTTLMDMDDQRAVEPIIAVLEDSNEEVRYWAAGALGKLDDVRAADALAAAAGNPGDLARGAAVGSLVELHDPRAVDLAIAALGDPDWRVAGSAAGALKKAHDARAIPALIAMIQQPTGDKKYGYARWQAADALETLRDVAHPVKPLVDALMVALNDPDTRVRSSAAVALGEFGDRRAVPSLIALLDDKDPNAVNAARVSLGKLKDPRAVEPLTAQLSQPDSMGGYGSAAALGQIGDPRAIEPLISALRAAKDDFRRDATASSLGKLGKPAIGPLLDLMKDPDSALRRSAALALAEMDDERVGRALDKALRQHDLVVVSGADLFFLKQKDDPAVGAALLDALQQNGDLRLANDLFRSGDKQLERAAIAWGSRRGYMVLGNGAGEHWLGRLMD